MAVHPFERAAIDRYPDRAAWDAASVDLLASMLDRWSLTPGQMFTGGFAATVVEVTDAEGRDLVMKLAFPHCEAIAEPVALDSFPPGSGPRVLRVDAWSWAMLLERIRPGTPLSQHPVAVDEAIEIGCALLARVQHADIPSEVPSLSATLIRFIEGARGRLGAGALERLSVAEIVETAFDDALELLDVESHTRFVHGDFNPGNILLSGHEWAAIDPKPTAGDGAYDLWPLLSQLGVCPRGVAGATEVRRRAEIASRIADVDARRVIRWGRVRAALAICWYLEENDAGRAAEEVAVLRAWDAASP